MITKNKLARGLHVGRLVLCFPLGKDKRGNRFWICKCDCGNYCKRRASVLLVAIFRHHESACRECNRELARIRLEKARTKIQEYRLNLPRNKERYKKMWDKHHDLYHCQYQPKEILSLMHEFVREFGPVREWELGDGNFSLDGTYEDEVKQPMIVKYCDICGVKLGEDVSNRNYFDDQIRKFVFPATKTRSSQAEVHVKLSVTSFYASCTEICSECVKKVVMEGKEVEK